MSELEEVKFRLAREIDARASERAGRIRAETELRELKLRLGSSPRLPVHESLERDDIVTNTKAEPATAITPWRTGRNLTSALSSSPSMQAFPSSFTFLPAATFYSCFAQRNGTPRQPSLVPLARGRIQLHSHVAKESLEGLSQFSHLWLLFVFHLNTDLHQTVLCAPHERNTGRNQKRSTVKAKVRVPSLGGEKKGVFATRTPHRPVPIGMSLVELRSIEFDGGYLEVVGADLVDGTPILDLKPYIPFSDAPSSGTSTGFVPGWVTSACGPPEKDYFACSSVSWAPNVRESLRAFWISRGGFKASLYDNPDEFLGLVEQVLFRDIRSTHQRSKKTNCDDVCRTGKWRVVLDGISIRYDISTTNDVVIVAHDKDLSVANN